jgi:hypothetical protein
MSRGRAGKTNTQNWIPEKWRSRVVFIVPNNEVEAYGKALGHKFRIWPAAEHVTNYSQKFQWILDGLPRGGVRDDPFSKCLIVDDDLVFSSRSDPSRPNSLISIKDPELTQDMWDRIEAELDNYALVGVHPRQMGNMAKRPYEMNGRIICMQGLNREMIGHVKVDQFPILADVVLSCTLLGRGIPNILLTTFFQDHGPCQAPGGCSIYRTPGMQRDAVSYLASRWPSCVKMVERRAKQANWLGGDSRWEYTCQWKQLYKLGLEWKNGRGPSPDREYQGTTPLLDKGAL